MKRVMCFMFCVMIISFTVVTYNRKNVTLGKVSLFEMGSATLMVGNNYEQEVKINLKDKEKLKKAFYAIDKKTGMEENLFNLDKFEKENLHIKNSGNGPKILIFHTHGSEMYADSKDTSEGVIGAGEYLKSILEDKYGVECLHITDKFDIVDGRLQRDGAYERAEVVISQVIKENPSIEVVIDLHRDGVNENLKLVTNIDGKNYAKIMLFNGICKKWDNGKLINISGLENPYLKTNLALSFQMQCAITNFNSSIARKIYINAYRYSLHMKDKSMLIELGAQTNTYKEALNSVEVIAEALAKVCL